MFVVGNNPFFAVKQFVHLLPAFFVFALHFGSNMDFFNFHIFGKFFHNFQKRGMPSFKARSIFFTPSGTGRPQSPITIVSVCPISASTLAISLFKIPIFCIRTTSLPLHLNKAFRPARRFFVRIKRLPHWQK